MNKTTKTNCALAAVALLFNTACSEQNVTNEEHTPKIPPETISLIKPETNPALPPLQDKIPNDPLVAVAFGEKTAELALISDPDPAQKGLIMSSAYIAETGQYDTLFYISGGKSLLETNKPVAKAFAQSETTAFKNCHIDATKINDIAIFTGFHCKGVNPAEIAKALTEMPDIDFDEDTIKTITTSTEQFTGTVNKNYSNYVPKHTMI